MEDSFRYSSGVVVPLVVSFVLVVCARTRLPTHDLLVVRNLGAV
jgi:hypothetical protein